MPTHKIRKARHSTGRNLSAPISFGVVLGIIAALVSILFITQTPISPEEPSFQYIIPLGESTDWNEEVPAGWDLETDDGTIDIGIQNTTFEDNVLHMDIRGNPVRYFPIVNLAYELNQSYTQGIVSFTLHMNYSKINDHYAIIGLGNTNSFQSFASFYLDHYPTPGYCEAWTREAGSDITATNLPILSEGTHQYRIDYSQERINFYVDSNLVANLTENIPSSMNCFRISLHGDTDLCEYWIWDLGLSGLEYNG